ncbi:D-alanine--D-alanine ligase [bacterium]|nr:D-alanine--D-alanine ligase [bacterium]
MDPITVMLLFGGRSPEHDVSLVSALGILSNIHQQKYRVLPVKISREGHWMLLDSIPSLDSTEALSVAQGPAILLGDPSLNGFYITEGPRCGMTVPVDVIFPVLHGPFGEDGTVQGLASLSNIPCAGAGLLGSALGMDKVMMKQLFIQNDLETTDFIWFLRSAWQKKSETIVRGVREAVGYPCFVKPANAGSSVGISKVTDEKGLAPAVALACEYDRKILIEKSVDARELECAVLGNDDPEASVVGEIIPCNEFYDYNAKYVDEDSKIVIPADIPLQIANRVRHWAVAAFRTLDCSGMSRVDFLLERNTNRICLNEINTIPGFTPISMYTKLWEASGLTYPNLIDRLIDLAIDRHRDIQQSKFYR